MPLGLNPVPGSARSLKPIKPIKPIKLTEPIEPIEATVQKKTTPKGRRWFGCSAGVKSQRLIQKGLNSISGNKWLNSIMMTAVMVNQIAENTGAVVRNFFMVLEVGDAGGMSE